MAYPISMKKQKEEKESYKVEEPKGYNGWTNYETWDIALNIHNDQGLYEESREAIKSGEIKNGDSYKEWFKERTETDQEGFYKVSDGWSERELDNDVDWQEIYESHKNEY